METSTNLKSSKENPFLKAFEAFDEAIPFQNIRPLHYKPALQMAIKTAKSYIDSIIQNPESATFQNTIEALEIATQPIHPICDVFFNLFNSDSNEDIQALAPDIASLQATFQSDLLLNEKLFKRVKKVYQQDMDVLNVEQQRLVQITYRSFVRNGGLLDLKDKKKLRDLDQKLARLFPQFSEKSVKSMSAFVLHVEDPESLKDLPEPVLAMAKTKAQEKNLKGWVFGLEMPSYIPFMTYCSDRTLRQRIWKAYSSRCFRGDFDTSHVINDIVKLRHERARLLGYQSHADYVLEERMAQNPNQVQEFLQELIQVSRPAAQKDLKLLQDIFAMDHPGQQIAPWDILYCQEKLKLRDFAFRQEDLRPYFPLEQVLQGAFDLAHKLYRLSFQKRTDIPKYHPEVDVYEVKDTSTGQYMALFYTDFFPRPTKKTGAWMTTFRSQGLFKGKIRRPHVSIVCNFTRPTTDKPSLLTFDEAETLFHEFGHALHAMLSKCHYTSLASPNVYWDFVELPSQFMQNWLMERSVLNLFAKHYQKGDLIPEDLFQKMKATRQYMAGYRSLRQLNFAVLDMAWHVKDPGCVEDIEQFEKNQTAQTALLPPQKGVTISHAFDHIFGGGYSAGYYSYKWAEVLDADAFEYFKENGLFNRATADSFRQNILEKGNTEDPMVLYKRFRGQQPDLKALLKRDGLLNEKK